MKTSHLTLFAAISCLGVFATGTARATNHTLWIHGRNTGASTKIGNPEDFSYWGSSNTQAGVNKKAVNWDGVGRISTTNGGIRDALDCYCTGANWCYVLAHSAGDLQIGYALDFYGQSARKRKDARPAAGGVCGDVDGSSQTGWNIYWVGVAGGAGGGSELANLGHWLTSDPLTGDLRTGTARGLYNHNLTRGVTFYLAAGAKGSLYSAALPGQDDEAVAYHSSGGLASTGSFCNPGDWFCDGDLALGTAGSDGVAKWAYHSVVARDDGENLDHFTRGSWGGVVGRARTEVVLYASQ